MQITAKHAILKSITNSIICTTKLNIVINILLIISILQSLFFVIHFSAAKVKQDPYSAKNIQRTGEIIK